MAEFEIKVQELESGGKQYDFVLSRAWLDRALAEVAVEGATPLRADASKGEGEVSVFAEKSGEDVVVRGRVRASLIAECSRCLSDAAVPVASDVTALFTPRAEALRVMAEDEDLSPDELDTEVYSGDTVVLDSLVREHVLLEVPMQTLCSETCEGLEVPPEVRGPADLTDAPVREGKRVDPRLAPLLELMNETKKKGS
jgi:uncharacterized protein